MLSDFFVFGQKYKDNENSFSVSSLKPFVIQDVKFNPVLIAFLQNKSYEEENSSGFVKLCLIRRKH